MRADVVAAEHRRTKAFQRRVPVSAKRFVRRGSSNMDQYIGWSGYKVIR
jgi:hypothetical protein